VSDIQHLPATPSAESTTLRSRFGIVLVVIVWVICGVALVALVTEFNILQLVRYLALIAFAAYAVWILFWSPSVTIAPYGVGVRNLLRNHAISWPAIQRVDTRFALTLYTTAGKIVAWSAPAPSRFAAQRASRGELAKLPESTYGVGDSIRPGDIPRSDSGLAALYVRRHWEQLRDGGYLDRGVVEGTGVVTTWLRRENAILLGLLVLAVAGLIAVR
jgi:hypothetical protein